MIMVMVPYFRGRCFVRFDLVREAERERSRTCLYGRFNDCRVSSLYNTLLLLRVYCLRLFMCSSGLD